MDTTSLHRIDLAVIVVYMTAVVGIGLYFMRRPDAAADQPKERLSL